MEMGLHSNMVKFKSLPDPPPSSSPGRLHSNMVKFKYFENMGIPVFKRVYIPIWLNSNLERTCND